MSTITQIKRINFLGAVNTAKLVVRAVTPINNPVLAVPFLRFDVDAGEPDTTYPGQMWWNADEETVDLRQNGAVLQLGQEQQWHITNNSGAQIDNGAVVMATGAIGATGRITGGLMDGTDRANARYILGVATEDIADNGDGKVSTFGKVRDIDTSGQGAETWSDGDILYVSPTVLGALTNIEPTSQQVEMPIAFVVKANPSVGTLAVRVTPIDEHVWAEKNANNAEIIGAHTLAASDLDKYTTLDASPLTIADTSVAAIADGQIAQFVNVSGGDIVIVTTGSATYFSKDSGTTLAHKGSITIVKRPDGDAQDFNIIGGLT